MLIRLIAVFLVATSAAHGASEIWIESPLTNVLPDTEPGPRPREAIRLYAARGESESVQICIRGGRGGFGVESVEAEALDDDIGAPDIYRVGYLQVDEPSPRARHAAPSWPDPLLAVTPFEVSAKETRALWVTYRVPESAKAGSHKGSIRLVPKKGAARTIPVTVEVFDFTLPEVPSLAAYFPLDRKAIRTLYGLPDAALERWKPIYDALSKERISFGLWNDGNLVKIGADGSADAAAFKEHLEYAVAASNMAAVNIGKGNEGISPFPAPPEGEIQDSLQLYLHDIGTWMESRGWLDRAFVQPLPAQESGEWQAAREAYFRVWRADKRIHRLLSGGLHPMLERYTDIWAVPLRYYQPFAQQRVQDGFSLRAEPAHPVAQFSASSSGGAGTYSFVNTDPSEACDGSLFTAWISAAPPTERVPQWIRFDLAEPLRTVRIRVAWRPGLEPTEIRVRTSIDGRIFNDADTRWEHHSAVDAFDQSWSEGRFRGNKPFQSLVLEFAGTRNDGPVAVSEIEFGDPPREETVERIEPLRIWTYSLEGDFPSFHADAHPAEARLVGWACWGHKASGFLYDRLTRWPAAWKSASLEQPSTWAGGGSGANFLFYPGAETLTPSLRIERLRDGIEDYEYLKKLDAAVKDKRVTDPKLAWWAGPRFFAADASPDDIDSFAKRIEAARIEIGEVLGELGEEE